MDAPGNMLILECWIGLAYPLRRPEIKLDLEIRVGYATCLGVLQGWWAQAALNGSRSKSSFRLVFQLSPKPSFSFSRLYSSLPFSFYRRTWSFITFSFIAGNSPGREIWLWITRLIRSEAWPRLSNSKASAISVNQGYPRETKTGWKMENMSRWRSVPSNSVLHTLQCIHRLGNFLKNRVQKISLQKEVWGLVSIT